MQNTFQYYIFEEIEEPFDFFSTISAVWFVRLSFQRFNIPREKKAPETHKKEKKNKLIDSTQHTLRYMQKSTSTHGPKHMVQNQTEKIETKTYK